MANTRRSVVRTFPEVQDGDVSWCEEITEDGEVDVGPKDERTTALALAGMYYMEGKSTGVKFLVTEEDFQRGWKYT